jgi:hypothetical protein
VFRAGRALAAGDGHAVDAEGAAAGWPAGERTC